MLNNQGIGNLSYGNPWEFSTGVGPVMGATLPGATVRYQAAQVAASMPASMGADDTYNGPLANRQFLGEPFAVYLGMILLLVLMKVLSESPDIKILGKNVNPAFIRVGGYNWLVIGVSSATFIVLAKIITHKINVPGLSSAINAI